MKIDILTLFPEIALAPLGDSIIRRAQDAGIYDRASLAHGATLQGPALITEEETTTVLPLSRQARILGDGSIDITVQGG